MSANKKNIVAIIPARMGASRFPGKPMAAIAGMPMVGHVLKRSMMSKSVDLVCVATCDKEIFDYVTSIGGKAVMTANTHERASDRCAECMVTLEKEMGKKIDVVVMIQGDEPLIHPNMIDDALGPVKSGEANVVNLFADIDCEEDYLDPNEIKVVVGKEGEALYFSRRPIPFSKTFSKGLAFKQVCIIPFTREYLLKFNSLAQTQLEKFESIDMLRFLENKINVKMVYSKYQTVSVDTQEDLDLVDEIMRKDSLLKLYLNLN